MRTIDEYLRYVEKKNPAIGKKFRRIFNMLKPYIPYRKIVVGRLTWRVLAHYFEQFKNYRKMGTIFGLCVKKGDTAIIYFRRNIPDLDIFVHELLHTTIFDDIFDKYDKSEYFAYNFSRFVSYVVSNNIKGDVCVVFYKNIERIKQLLLRYYPKQGKEIVEIIEKRDEKGEYANKKEMILEIIAMITLTIRNSKRKKALIKRLIN